MGGSSGHGCVYNTCLRRKRARAFDQPRSASGLPRGVGAALSLYLWAVTCSCLTLNRLVLARAVACRA